MNRPDWPDSTVPQPMSTPTGGTNGTVSGTGTGGRRGAGGSAKRYKSSASSHQRRSIIVPPSNYDEERRSLVEGEEPPSEDEEGEDEEEDEEDGSGEYVDEEEVENAIVNGTPSAATAMTTGAGGSGQKTIPWGRKHIGHQPDEEDDELMMYAKVEPFLLPLRAMHSVDAVNFTG